MQNNNGCSTGSCCGSSCCDLGLLVLRLGIGVLFMVHGWPKIMGGVDKWEALGGAMATLGITFAPVFWGFMAAFAEFVGGLFLALGILVRPFAAMLAFTMIVAVVMLLDKGAAFSGVSNAAHMIVVFVALMITGGGNLSLGHKIGFLRGKCYQ